MAGVNRDVELRKVHDSVGKDGVVSMWRYKPALRVCTLLCTGGHKRWKPLSVVGVDLKKGHICVHVEWGGALSPPP